MWWNPRDLGVSVEDEARVAVPPRLWRADPARCPEKLMRCKRGSCLQMGFECVLEGLCAEHLVLSVAELGSGGTLWEVISSLGHCHQTD